MTAVGVLSPNVHFVILTKVRIHEHGIAHFSEAVFMDPDWAPHRAVRGTAQPQSQVRDDGEGWLPPEAQRLLRLVSRSIDIRMPRQIITVIIADPP